VGQRAVAHGSAGRDPPQRAPDALLERSASRLDRDAVHRGQIARQVRAELGAQAERVTRPAAGNFGIARGELPGERRPPELERAEAPGAGRDSDRPDRTRDLVDEQHRLLA